MQQWKQAVRPYIYHAISDDKNNISVFVIFDHWEMVKIYIMITEIKMAYIMKKHHLKWMMQYLNRAEIKMAFIIKHHVRFRITID